MKTLFDPRKMVVPPIPSRSKFRVVFVVGGMKQALAQQLARRPNTAVFVIDVDEETGRVRFLMVTFGVQTFSLGTNESLATLSENSNPQIRAAAREVAAMLARDGCGASPTAGRLAALNLVRTREFQHALDSVVDRAIKSTGGSLPYFEVIVLGSYCGGVCAGASTVLAEAMMDKLATLPVTVKVVLDLIGAITVTGISPLAGQNAASTLPHLVHFAITANQWKYRRMMVSVHLSELPPFGQDHEARNQVIKLDEQSIRCLELQEQLNRISPNQSTTSPLGNVGERQFEIFNIMNLDLIVLPSLATQFLPMLTNLRERVISDPSIVRELTWVDDRRTLNRRSVAEIVNDADSLTFEEFRQALFLPGEEVTYAWRLDLGPEGEFEPTKIDEYFADPPPNATAAVKRLSLSVTFKEVANDEVTALSNNVNHIKDGIESQMPYLRKLFRKRKDPAFWQNVQKAIKELTQLGETLRGLNDQQLDLQAQMIPVKLGLSKVKTEETFLNDRLNDLQNLLERYAPRGRDSFRGDLVILPSLDDAFTDLWRLTLQPEAEQRVGLARLAVGVTLQGLAHIVNCPVAKVDDIAKQIVQGTPALQCPPHGGLMRTDHIQTAYVLPPTDGAFAESLRQAIRQLASSPNTIVVFADSTEAGMTVARYTFRDFKDVKQLMGGMLWHDLQRAEDSANGTLRFPTGRNELDELQRLLDEASGEAATDMPQDSDDRYPLADGE